MIVHSKRLIFVHIQKTAGSSVRLAFREDPNPSEKHFFACQLRELYGTELWNAYFKFAFVRNPWDRLVSWWSNIETSREVYAKGLPLNKFQSFVLSRASTFEEFLLNCDQEIPDHDGRKWIYRNQIDYLADKNGQLIVDFVGRFENIKTHFKLASRKAIGRVLDLPRTNATVHRHYSEYYSEAMAEYVGIRFRRDIEAFGYVFERNGERSHEADILTVQPWARWRAGFRDWKRFMEARPLSRRSLVSPETKQKTAARGFPQKTA
jgi:chondroitin 4-sulfotransferase 11